VTRMADSIKQAAVASNIKLSKGDDGDEEWDLVVVVIFSDSWFFGCQLVRETRPSNATKRTTRSSNDVLNSG
jgi:hypothetical protein